MKQAARNIPFLSQLMLECLSCKKGTVLMLECLSPLDMKCDHIDWCMQKGYCSTFILNELLINIVVVFLSLNMDED